MRKEINSMVLWVLFIIVVVFGIWFYVNNPFEKIKYYNLDYTFVKNISKDKITKPILLDDSTTKKSDGKSKTIIANDQKSDKKISCNKDGGIWYTDDNTCEINSLSESECKIKGGEYNECASACRHEPKSAICTMQCVVTCSFK